jgi:hypothetical protein
VSDEVKVCVDCKQPIRDVEKFGRTLWPPRGPGLFHSDSSDCIAAVVRRCAEIAKEWRGPEREPSEGNTEASIMIESSIKSEFSEAFEDAARLLAEMGKS